MSNVGVLGEVAGATAPVRILSEGRKYNLRVTEGTKERGRLGLEPQIQGNT